MRKFLISIIGVFMVFSVFAAGENVTTSKSYVDSVVAEKQDTIDRTTGDPQVLTNTGTAGEYGTKDIYDSTASYSGQSKSLIDAVTMNTAVQNAIDSEFQCVEYNPNDPTDCWLMDIRSITDKPSGKNLLEPSFMDNSTYGPITVNGNSFYAARILPTENGKTYTLSANLTYTGTFYYYLARVLPNGELEGYNSVGMPCRFMWNAQQGNQQTGPCTFTASDNATYIVYWAGAQGVAQAGKNNLTLSNYQMEEGSVATAYEPYKNLYVPSGN